MMLFWIIWLTFKNDCATILVLEIYIKKDKGEKIMDKKGPISGTFIDEITFDIPSSNWSREQWVKDLDYMQEIGIDTVIFIRGGYQDKSVFPSKVLGTYYADDLAGLIFDETSKRDMKVIFGAYISNGDWNRGDYATEIKINKEFVNEVYERYGEYPSFSGWYIPHEVTRDVLNITEIMSGLSAIFKDKTPDKKVMMSPIFRGQLTGVGTDYFTPERQADEWDKMFDKAGKDIDICAFQDGSAPTGKMEEYYTAMREVCKKHNIEHWVNAETFERDVRNVLYPIPFQELKRRLEMHKKYAEKIITFEFSHFLSPQSIYPSARNLNNLYKEYYLK